MKAEEIVGSTVTLVYESRERKGVVCQYNEEKGKALINFFEEGVVHPVCIKDVQILIDEGDDDFPDHPIVAPSRAAGRDGSSMPQEGRNAVLGTERSPSKWGNLGVATSSKKLVQKKERKSRRCGSKLQSDRKQLKLTNKQQQSEAVEPIQDNREVHQQNRTSSSPSSSSSSSSDDNNSSPEARGEDAADAQTVLSPVAVGRKTFTAAGGLTLKRHLFHSELRAWAREGDKTNQQFTAYKSSHPNEYRAFIKNLESRYPECFHVELVDILLGRKFAYERWRKTKHRRVMAPRKKKKKSSVLRGGYGKDDIPPFLHGGYRR